VQAFGKRTVVHGIHKRWVTPEVVEACEQRRRAHAQHVSEGSVARAAALRAATDAAKATCKAAQRAHHLRTEEAAQRRWTRCPGSRQAWKILRELDTPATAQPLDALVHPETGDLCTDTADKVQALSSHFQSLLQPAAPRSEAERAQRERSEATVAALRKESVGHVEGLDSEFTDEEVRDALRCMENHKAPGQDGMQAELLKYSVQAGVRMICAVCNVVRRTECMPAGWRDGVMVPLPKNGVIVQRTITEVIVHARAIAVWRVELTRPREQHTGATVPHRHCTASTRHPCGVLRVSLCAACPLKPRPFVRVLSVAFPPTTPSCLVHTAHGPAAVLHCDLSGLRENYAFSCTHVHTP
jgi:hypothetical protein